jgi:tetratricopeptide (TPR) repeat protein
MTTQPDPGNTLGTAPSAKPKRKLSKPVGPRLKVLLIIVLGLASLLAANSLYLLAVTVMEWVRGLTYQNYFYQYMFLAHLALGILFVLPFVLFGVFHLKNAYRHPKRRAVRIGYMLFAISLIVLITGFGLMRLGERFNIKSPPVRYAIYWAHILAPLAAIWLYILHRLAGPKIKWRIGARFGLVTAGLVGVMVWFSTQDPRKWGAVGPKEGTKYFEPSLARTASGNFIPAKTLMMDQYCMECHKDNFDGWFHSAHRFSSFNNKPYLFSVRETRQVALKRDGNVKAARWCAGCHDVVPFFSGAFDDPKFDDVNHPTAHAGITCTTCHAITHVNSTRGNADYTIEEPIHYPFAFSDKPLLQWVNRQLVKAKPDFHKKTFLKPLHKTAEFCSTCHKVHLPKELNHYKEFLRGQNHYDTFLLSGVSGHSARSFYYPPVAQANCNGCHMPTKASNDFGARFFDPAQPKTLMVHNHLFPTANTGVAHIRGEKEIVKAHQEFLKGVVRVDIFGLREGGTVDGKLTAPLRPSVPELEPGKTYLLEVVLRTVKMGHPFTQGTVDSNEVWVDVATTAADLAKPGGGGRVVGRSGALGAANEVDPWSHFVNVYMLDRDGNRIDRRNPQDIFTPLYNHQIPPGAGQVVHYSLTVPPEQREPLTVEVKLQYRKFDTKYMQYVFGKDFVNDLPITTIAADTVTFAVKGGVGAAVVANPASAIPEWQRWNDYGIGLLLEGDKGSEKGELIQAAAAFAQVEKLKKADGPLNLARVYFKEGRLDDAIAAQERAAKFDPPAPRWTVAWLNGLVNKQNGYLDKAISEFRSVLEDRYPELEQRKFDFSKDYEVINELGLTYFERAKLERGDERKAEREKYLNLALETFAKTLALDSENVTAHHNTALVYAALGNEPKAAEHRKLHERYRTDDNARDRAVAIARKRDAAADHAAQAIVIYDLHRPGAPGLDPGSAPVGQPQQQPVAEAVEPGPRAER